MKKLFLLLLIVTYGCTSSKFKDTNVAIFDLGTDFPNIDTCTFETTLQQTFRINNFLERFIVKDSILFAFVNGDKDAFGYCFNINNGEKLLPIICPGRATNEMLELHTLKLSNNNLHGDSIQFFASTKNEIKTFAINDIITKRLGDRAFSVSEFPDSCYSFSSMKLDDATIFGTFNGSNPSNIYKYFTFDGKNISCFGELNDTLYKSEQNLDNNNKRNLVETLLANRGNKIVAAESNGILLQIVDAKKQTIDIKRYYTPIVIDGSAEDNTYFRTRNEYRTIAVRCDDKRIYCLILKSEKDPEIKVPLVEQKCYIFTFDWELNPIKQYYIGTFDQNSCNYYLSEKGDVIYRLTNGETEQELHKYNYLND